ncbi:MAG: DNA-3-methyladenine glycosylase 2 family protein [Actinobacteria bacterium]|nr:DNA-3-methyladenine glycosylase 2 family protein [Actinomycetota bacterium]
MARATSRSGWRDAADELARRHPVLDRLHTDHGPPTIGPGAAPDDRFAATCRAVAYQQLAGRAASVIWSRVVQVVGEPFDPASVVATGPERLRSAGLSGAKVATLLSLAEHTADGTVDWRRLARLDDTAVIADLTQVRGIGPWTAQMFLMFELRRADVWPTGDLGVRNGYAQAFGLDDAPDARELARLGEPWAPYRSVVAWWCWREVDPD